MTTKKKIRRNSTL